MVNCGKFFENENDAKFDYVLVGTGLSECILATLLARTRSKVLHVDSSESYGGSDASLSYTQFKLHVEQVDSMHVNEKVCDIIERSSILTKSDRQFSIDISVPKILFCQSPSVDFLVSQQVSKYLSFLPLKQLLVDDWEFPTSRAKVFSDKFLSMSEKRGLMSLFKSVVSNSSAVHSTAMVSAEVAAPQYSDDSSITAVAFLKSNFKIERIELVQAIIHGMCLFPFAIGSMMASDLQCALARFVGSLTAFGDGNALLVPMYGNSDIPQAFARAAAVEGAMYILNCSFDQLKTEVSPDAVVINATNAARDPQVSVLHSVLCLTDISTVHVSLKIIAGASHSSSPVYLLTLPNTSSSPGGVAPAGTVLMHMFQLGAVSQDEAHFDALMATYATENCVFATRFRHEASAAHPFNIQDNIEWAREQFNVLRGLEKDTPIPQRERSASTDS